jgi:dihydropteroate synthase
MTTTMLSLANGALSLVRPRVMGIVNVTPDSFSDGGQFENAAAAIAHGMRLLADGADILDVGGESTRPGAPAVPADAQHARVVPVIAALARAGALVSVDTSSAPVMRAALDAGAVMINDVRALREPGAVEGGGAVAVRGVPRSHAGDACNDAGRSALRRCRARGPRLPARARERVRCGGHRRSTHRRRPRIRLR